MFRKIFNNLERFELRVDSNSGISGTDLTKIPKLIISLKEDLSLD